MAEKQNHSHSPSLSIVQPPTQRRTSNGHAQVFAARPMNTLPTHASHTRPSRMLYVCGSGGFGLLGMGSTEDATVDLREPRLHVWFEIAVLGQSHMLGAERGAGIEQACAGGVHSLVIDESGNVWSWGVNNHAALGRQTIDIVDPDAPNQLIDPEILEFTPMLVSKLAEEGFRTVQVAAGDSISVALNEEGIIRAWGCFRAADGLLGFRPFTEQEKANLKDVDPETLPRLDPMSIELLEDERFVQIACGSDHILALSQYGIVYCWGNGQHAQLGRKIVERHKINGLVPTRILIQRLVYIAAGAYNSFAVNEKGIVYAWGLNQFRQTGVQFPDDYEGDKDVIWAPMQVTALGPSVLGNGRRVVQICGGEHHTIFLLNDGSVYGCGRCDASELGLAADHPMMIEQANDTSHPAQYDAWQGTHKFIETPTFIQFPPPPKPTDPDPSVPPHGSPNISNPISRIASCARHSLAISRAGHAYAWGSGPFGELGCGVINEQKTPRRVRSATLDELRKDGKGWKWIIEDVTTGGQHTIFVARPTV